MQFLKFNTTLLAIWLLSACTIGNGRICGPQTPSAYCDKEAYEKLMHPTPLVDKWEKNNITTEQRKLDWIACGGDTDGWYQIKDIGNFTAQEYRNASRKKSHTIQNCMIKKKYHYIGICYDNDEISRESPACRDLKSSM